MKLLNFFLFMLLTLFVAMPTNAQDVAADADSAVAAETVVAETDEEGGLNMNEYLFGHIGDSYEWHITTINSKPVSIPLPVIVRSKTNGWHLFSSHHIVEGKEYEGFFISQEEQYKGKIVERASDGTLVRPLDLSMTKNVLGLLINCALIVGLVLGTARWYRRHDVLTETPRGLAGLMEMLITMVENDIIKEGVGKDYKRYSPYLLTAFFFIFINNLMGIVPFFPGGANITGNIAVTLTLAMCTFFAVNLFGNKHYWKEILWPDVPVWLKVPVPLMPLIEIIGLFTKPFSLMIRLFANIMAGHCMLLGVVAVIFITAKMGPVINGSLSIVAVLFGVFMDLLECLVAFLQAYVFTMLSAVFIGMSRQENEEQVKKK